MKKLILRLFGTAAFMAASAMAADMPVKAPAYRPPAAIVADSWTGIYIGASVGGRWNRSDWTTTSVVIPPAPATAINNPATFSNSSGRAGIYLGFNWQLARFWVVGIEGDIAWADNKSTTSPIPGVFGILVPTQDFAERKDGWDGGVRGRIGFLINPNLLLFGTGGISWMRSEASVHCGNTAPNWCSGTNFATLRVDTVSTTVLGWTIGGGLEWMLYPNWLIRGEYRYAQYDGYHFDLLRGGSTGSGNVDFLTGEIGRIRSHTALFGVAYKFGGAVVAKY